MNIKLSLAAALASVALFSACCTEPCKIDPSAWAPAGEKIMTPWGESLDPTNVLPEYPRPQLVRSDWQNLNGLWEYAIVDATSGEPKEFDGQILVPFAVESALSGVGKTLPDSCALWYKTCVNVPKAWKGRRVRLNFGAVDFKAEVFLNGKKAIEHCGGYTPFSVDITPYLKGGKATLTLRVEDHTDSGLQARGKQVGNPQGIFYTSVSGIWQTVWMEPTEATVIENYYCSADLVAGRLSVLTGVIGAEEGDVVKVSLLSGGLGYDALNPSTEVLSQVSCAPTEAAVIDVTDVCPWTPDSPYLYGLKIEVIRGDKVVDSVNGYAAMREIGVVTDAAGFKRMALNGSALFQFGPLDQGWWPDGLYTAPSDEALKFDLVKTKEFGYNMIRKHVKVEPARWYTYCDQLGILVWQDMPHLSFDQPHVWSQHSYEGGTDSPLSDEAKADYYHEWTEIINARRTFPCIVVWVPFNEAWAQFDTEKVVDFTRSLDSTRLIDPASGGNHTHSGDMLDNHHYPNPKMVFINKDYINVLGEFGGIGLPLEGHLWQTDQNWGYIKYTSTDEVTDAYVQFADELIGFIKKGYSAAVYTQTTDVEGEVNGLMTYDRKVIKHDITREREANQKVIASMTE